MGLVNLSVNYAKENKKRRGDALSVNVFDGITFGDMSNIMAKYAREYIRKTICSKYRLVISELSVDHSRNSALISLKGNHSLKGMSFEALFDLDSIKVLNKDLSRFCNLIDKSIRYRLK